VVAALAVCCEQMARRSGGDPTTEAMTRLAEFKSNLREHRESHRLFVEMLGVGLHNRAVAEGVIAFMRQDRALVESLVREVIAVREDRSQAEAPALAAAISAAVIGIIAQNLLDPEFAADAAVDALTAMALK